METLLCMTFYDFLRLNHEERTEHILEFGIFLTSCPGRALYDLGKFYAELVYDSEQNKIVEARGFRSLRNLEPYLGYIDMNLDDKE
ncbi:hypothetical protein HUW51_00860 (plasmid) [Adhaeribacter swui]|uniref:Uncharacterized protein n=1 Tax=Adhaeribacter swui TaxID=2086471 RepID=A0A7G7G2F4_9BACT|nr:hypothetical protein [Adhaeribacter swui]QNF31338.1 hypothetical protein HUW51_00860 [Adhaeribacter swui]